MPMEDKIYSIGFLLAYMAIIWILLLITWIKRPKVRDSTWKWSFGSFLLLAFGDFFHLVPRTYLWYLHDIKGITDIYSQKFGILLYGFGLVMTSITVTLFYFGMYMFWRNLYATNKDVTGLEKEKGQLQLLDFLTFTFVLLRLSLIAYPMNSWGNDPYYYGGWFSFRYLTNLPLFAIGVMIIVLFLKSAKVTANSDVIPKDTTKTVKNSAIWIIVSYVCYSITVFGVHIEPLLGMFMIPKTIAYLVVLFMFYKNFWIKKN